MDAFRMLDKESKGWINVTELKTQLRRALGLNSDEADVELFAKFYDKNHDGKLIYSEFCGAFAPKDRHYQQMLEFRKPQIGPGNEHFSMLTLE